MTLLNDTERFVIELADALTQTPSNISDDLYARLRNQFSEEQLMQLGAQIAFENYRARWNRSSTSRATIFIMEVARPSHGRSQHLAGRDRRARWTERTARRSVPTIYWMTSGQPKLRFDFLDEFLRRFFQLCR